MFGHCADIRIAVSAFVPKFGHRNAEAPVTTIGFVTCIAIAEKRIFHNVNSQRKGANGRVPTKGHTSLHPFWPFSSLTWCCEQCRNVAKYIYFVTLLE